MIARQIARPFRSNTFFHQRGLTLVEGVLALLLLASLIIGIATLYAVSGKEKRGGQLHNQAVKLAKQMAAEIRSNQDARSDFETSIGATCSEKYPAKNSIAHDVACWQEQVGSQLTNGSSRISLDTSTVPAEYVIVVNWSEPRTGTASYVMRVAKPNSAKK